MRTIATVLLVVALCASGAAQVVPVSKEPHHKVVYEDAHLRVLDVVIPSGTTTLEHSHDHDLITVSIGQADTRIRTPGSDWGPVRPRRPVGDVSTVDYAGQRGTHTIQNVGPDPYRLLAVENVGQSGWRATPAAATAGVRVTAESRAFRASAVTLDAEHERITRLAASPAVLVLVSGQAVLTKRGRPARTLQASSRWAVVDGGTEYMLASAHGDARLIEIEVR
jgi:hypothetical protein